ncbi:hypothetical protein PI124_g15699 [Phytophthora idaei]|nr:hypothetical protein PI125_g15803 [Phytophthora idaei]KAG3239363.1 hypothetical protein PI124_g15699 [Phytophthora idaei]
MDAFSLLPLGSLSSKAILTFFSSASIFQFYASVGFLA